ncbi:hypothetical protein ACFQS6_21275 [Xanthomonas populi]
MVIAGENEDFQVSEESLALAWRPIAELLAEPELDLRFPHVFPR